MRSTFKVTNEGLVEITTVIDLNEVAKELTASKGDSRWNAERNLVTQVQNLVADAVTKEFLLKHTGDVLKHIDTREVANLVTLKSVNNLIGDSHR